MFKIPKRIMNKLSLPVSQSIRSERRPRWRSAPGVGVSMRAFWAFVLMGYVGSPEGVQADPSSALYGASERSAIVSGSPSGGSILFGDAGILDYGELRVIIPKGFLLAGFGEVIGKVSVHGKTEPGFVSLRDMNWVWLWRNPISKLTVTGSYTLAKDGILVIDVASPTKHDVLRVHGTARLFGTLRIDALGYQPKIGDKIPIVQADDIEGRFLTIRTNLPGRFRYDFKKLGNTGYLVVGKASPRRR